MNKKLVALSIGSSSIAAAVGVDNNGEFDLQDTMIKASKGVCKGKIVDIDLAREAIMDILEEISRKNLERVNSVYLAIGTQDISIRRNRGSILVESNKVVDQGILSNAYIDARNIDVKSDEYIIDAIIREIYLDGENVKVDFMGTKALSVEMDVDVVIAKKNSIVDIKNIFDSIDCEINSFILSLESLRKMFKVDNINSQSNLLIDFGTEKTEFIYFEESSIKEIGRINLGGADITKDLSIITKSDIDLIEEVKIKYSDSYDSMRRSFAKIELGEGNIDADLFYEVINARIEEILSYVKKDLENLDIYDKIENITIFGDAIGSFENIENLIESILGKKPKIFTKNEVNVEKSSIIMPIAIVKEVYDRLKLLGEDKTVKIEEIDIINSIVEVEDSNEDINKVKKKGLSKVLGFLGDIF